MENDFGEAVATRLRVLRAERKLSRREVVDRLADAGVFLHQTALRRIEEGDQQLKFTDAVGLCSVYSIDLTELADQGDIAPNPDVQAKQVERKAKGLGGEIRAAAEALEDLADELDELEQTERVKEVRGWIGDYLGGGKLYGSAEEFTRGPGYADWLAHQAQLTPEEREAENQAAANAYEAWERDAGR